MNWTLIKDFLATFIDYKTILGFVGIILFLLGFWYVKNMYDKIKEYEKREEIYKTIIYSNDERIEDLKTDISDRDRIHKEQSQIITNIINTKKEVENRLEKSNNRLAKLGRKKPYLVSKILVKGYQKYMKCVVSVSEDKQDEIDKFCYYKKGDSDFYSDGHFSWLPF